MLGPAVRTMPKLACCPLQNGFRRLVSADASRSTFTTCPLKCLIESVQIPSTTTHVSLIDCFIYTFVTLISNKVTIGYVIL